MNFQKKLLFSYFLIMVFIMIASFSIIFVIIRNNIRDRELANLNEIMSKTITQIDNYVTSMDNLALQVFSNQTIRDLIDEANKDDQESNYFTFNILARNTIFKNLLTVNGPFPLAFRTSVFGLKGDYVEYGNFLIKDHIVRENFDSYDWIEKVYQLEGGDLLLSLHEDFWSDFNEFPLISLVRALRMGSKIFGFVQVDQGLPDIIDIVDLEREDIAVFLTDTTGNVIFQDTGISKRYADVSYYLGTLPTQDYLPIITRSPLTGKKEVVMGARSAVSGWVYLLVQPYENLFNLSRNVVLLLMGIALVAGFLVFQVNYFISKNISHPIRELSARLKQVQFEDQKIEFPEFHVNNDLEILRESMDFMFERLKQSMRETLEARTKELDAHFQALQSQINPHFLYNLFATMGSIARVEKSPRLTDICRQAASMLRYISRNSEGTVSLSQEVDHARSYAFLMCQRFEENIEIQINVPAEVLDVQVPKLFLQPLIENSYMHGFKTKPYPWRVEVVGKIVEMPDGRAWTVTVSDNGSGFDPDFLAGFPMSLQSAEDEGEGNLHTGLGLINIYERFSIYYKSRMIFEVMNRQENGRVSGVQVCVGSLFQNASEG